MSKVTFVVEFEDGGEPAIHAKMQFLGGRIIRVAWSDSIQALDDLQEELIRDELDEGI